MMKIFCDRCEVELSKSNEFERTETQLRPRNASVVISLDVSDMPSYTGHFCKYCVLDTIAALDDRPRT